MTISQVILEDASWLLLTRTTIMVRLNKVDSHK